MSSAITNAISDVIIDDIRKVKKFCNRSQEAYWIRISNVENITLETRENVVKKVKAVTGRNIRWITRNEIEISLVETKPNN